MTPRADLSAPQIDRLKQVFEAALSAPSGDRMAFVREACTGDSVLQDELSSLLDAHDASDGFFEKLAASLVTPALWAIELDDQDDAAVSDRNVSHYELAERIGGGGMGVVYKARDTRLGRTVALKFLPRRHAANPAARAGLLAEARAASALDHPNIGVVYEIGEADDGRQFIAMAWYDGETLKDKTRQGPLAVPEAVAIAAQLGSALAAAHRAGIIHRDVKPANVIVTQSGSVKLLDFGIAKLMSDADGGMHATAGTVAYMSPEQTRGAALDPRTDIWSLGVLMYEVLAGERPFKRDTDDLVVTAIRDEEPTALSSIRPEVPARLEAIAERCLRKDPAGRYQTAEEFSAALSRPDGDAESRATLQGKRPTGIARILSREHRGKLLVTSIVLVAVTVSTLAYSRYSRDANANTIGSISQPVSIAVLPLSDPTSNDSSRYLAVGLTDELRAELSRIGRVTVPSYVSSTEYSGTTKPISQVAGEMAAKFVVAGDVQRDPAGTHAHLRLVDGKTGRVFWSRNYDAGPAAASRFAGDVAKDIFSSLNVGLTRGEKSEIDRMPTNNPHAYDLYLQGRYAELSGTPLSRFAPTPENMRRAQGLYAQARSLDPNFALTRAKLAESHIFSSTTYDTTRARLDQARLEAEAALRLDSGLTDAHDALASYWSRSGNQPKSIEELEIGLHVQPNNVGLLTTLGTQYVVAGRWEEGVAKYDRAILLDPRDPRVEWLAGTTYGRFRRNDKAMRAFNRLIEIAPGDYVVRVIKGHCYLRWRGSADTLAASLRSLPPGWDQHGMATYGRYTVFQVQRRYKDGLAMLDRAPTELAWDTYVYQPKSLMRAELYRGLGDSRSARVYFESARATLTDSAAAHPNDPSIQSALGMAYAGLGRKREAVQHAERAMQLVPVSGNSLNATAFMGLAVEVFARVGELDRAFEMIELMLSMPSGREITLPFLRVWPGFDPLRGDPRFTKLLERFTIK